MAGEGNPAVLDDITAAQQYVLDLQARGSMDQLHSQTATEGLSRPGTE